MDFQTDNPVNTASDWTGHVTSSANLYENPFPKPVLFAYQAIIVNIEGIRKTGGGGGGGGLSNLRTKSFKIQL